MKNDYEELLESYAEEALDGVVYAKISNNGSYFNDKQHTNIDINLFLRYYFSPPYVDKYEYQFFTNTSSNKMDKGLYIRIVNLKNLTTYIYNGKTVSKIEKL